MKVKFHSSDGLSLGADERRELDTPVRERLTRHERFVTRATLYFSPSEERLADGTPRYTRCGIELRLAGRRPLKVRQTGPTAAPAANRALQKMLRIVERRVGRAEQQARAG